MADDNHLAYGDYHNNGRQGGSEGQRGLLSDTVNQFRSSGGVSSFLGKLSGAVQDLSNDLTGRFSDLKVGAQSAAGSEHRFGSFAQPRSGNGVKWYVDGCGYFWAVSEAIENAKESIWILDWWLSPELYLRRPPALNEKYRLDRLLKAAAERGVKINVIIYKEVSQALTLSSEYTKHTLEALHPENISVFRHPDHAPDPEALQSSLASSLQSFSLSTESVAKLPAEALKALYGANEDLILYWAHHEKLCLIDGEIAFMGGLDLCYGRWDTNQHPISDVHPGDLDAIVFPGQDYNNARIMDFQNVSQPENNKLERTKSSRMGWSDVSISLQGPVLADLESHFVQRWNFIYNLKYYSRKDHQYRPLLLPGQQPPSQQQAQSGVPANVNTDVSDSSPGQIQGEHSPHMPSAGQFYPPPPPGGPPSHAQQGYSTQPPQFSDQSGQYYPPPPPGGPPSSGTENYYPPPPTQSQAHDQDYTPGLPGGAEGRSSQPHTEATPYFPPPPGATSSRSVDESTRGFGDVLGSQQQGHGHQSRLQGLESRGFAVADKLGGKLHHAYNQYSQSNAGRQKPGKGLASMQLVRSCARWSNGSQLEHSIQNAYISAIQNSQRFIYIENQFFITATSPKQAPVMNKIGAALVERILRAARTGQKFKVVVLIPAVPGFAGDLRDESSLGTRAIMEFQYNAINRGGHSIMEEIAAAGFNPMDYIRFYNLRSYDRINYNPKLQDLEQNYDLAYEDVRRKAEDLMDPMGRKAQDGSAAHTSSEASYERFRQAAKQTFSDKERHWDSVSHCYMLGGPDIRTAPWEGDEESELNAFVSEELYIHTKILIADDRIVICGSANLNDRSQLGNHDSEIAMVIEDEDVLDSYMDGRPWKASRFAATLRRQLYRKHLGLLVPQHMMKPDANFHPVETPNEYDFGSPEDHLVQDPLADTFLNFWNSRARRNTEAFRSLFHPVPDDTVRNWKDYRNFYEQYFHKADEEAEGKAVKQEAKYEWGHIIREAFPQGSEGARQVKDLLSNIKGTLVEMPLMFLIEEDIAKQGLSLNAVTEPIYT